MEGAQVQGNSLGEIWLKQRPLSPWVTGTDGSACAALAGYSWQCVRLCSRALCPRAFWWKKHAFQFRSSGVPELCGFDLNSSLLAQVMGSSFWLNICVLSPKLVCWNPNTQGDGIRSWGLWVVMRFTRGHEGVAHSWNWCSEKMKRRQSLHALHVRTQQEDHHGLHSRKRTVTRS